MTGGPSEFDLNAAWVRRAQGDLKAFMEGFAVRMESALPGHVEVERRRDGFFSKTSHVVQVAVRGEHDVYILTFDGVRLNALRKKAVHGVTLKSESMKPAAWLEALDGEIKRLADHASSAQTILHDLLMS
jgi:hypothetical protein